MVLWSGIGAASLMLSVLALQSGEDETPAQLEQKAVFRELVPLAEKCAGKLQCFQDRIRPFGPWLVALGPAQSAENPAFASSAQNFAFGVVGGAAGVDPMAVNEAFFCGEACMRGRLDTMKRSVEKLRPIAARFGRSGLSLLALWPEGRIRADDWVIDAAGTRRGTRTPLLSIFRGWSVQGKLDTAAPVYAAREIATLMRAHGVIAVARDESGGIRVIHRDSIAENEVGLLFDPKRLPRPGLKLPDGARYGILERVKSGVYAYLRA